MSTEEVFKDAFPGGVPPLSKVFHGSPPDVISTFKTAVAFRLPSCRDGVDTKDFLELSSLPSDPSSLGTDFDFCSR